MSKTILPLILIDFDGVFNMVGTPQNLQDSLPCLERTTTPVLSDDKTIFTQVLFDRTVIDFFNQIIINRKAEVKWLTTWFSDTVHFPQYLGFEPIEWIDELQDGAYGQHVANELDWWKFDAVKKLHSILTPERKVLWIDDELNRELPALEWAKENKVSTLAPKNWRGLEPTHLNQILDFIKS